MTPKVRTTLRRLVGAGFAVSLTAAGACSTGGTYAGVRVVTCTSEPPGADVYVIKDDDWRALGGDEVLDDGVEAFEDVFEGYWTGVTPFDTESRREGVVFVAVLPDGRSERRGPVVVRNDGDTFHFENFR